jgi:hypothetical protein
MAYDGTRQRVVLFGGYGFTNGQSVLLNDTWTWDGTNWTQQLPPKAPAARFNAALTNDDATRTLVLFGGFGLANGFTDLDDTWTWNGSIWTQQFPPKSPSARIAPMTYDTVDQRVILQGGSQGGNYFNDTWTWDGYTWTQQQPPAAPPARYSPGFTFDSSNGVGVLFGGDVGYSPQLNDTWTFSLYR